MSKRPLKEFATSAQQALAPLAANSAAVAINGVLRLGVVPPVLPPPVGSEM
jgi:hypothetical protein